MALLKPLLCRKEGNNITVEEIRDWETQEVTIAFFGMVKELKDDANRGVHLCVSKGVYNDAAECNGVLRAAEDVLDLPNQMVEDIKKEKS